MTPQLKAALREKIAPIVDHARRNAVQYTGAYGEGAKANIKHETDQILVAIERLVVEARIDESRIANNFANKNADSHSGSVFTRNELRKRYWALKNTTKEK